MQSLHESLIVRSTVGEKKMAPQVFHGPVIRDTKKKRKRISFQPPLASQYLVCLQQRCFRNMLVSADGPLSTIKIFHLRVLTVSMNLNGKSK